MKKILTLMAAMSAVAGPAMAADYVWNVDATGNITAEEKGDIAFANNKFTFTVNSGEKVWVKGSNVTVSFGGVNLTGKEVTFDMEGAGLLYTPGATGQVTVTLGANSTIKKIKVVGMSSMEIEDLFEAVKAEVQKANQETAVWATESELEPFFTAVRAQINKQGAINQEVRALLENYQAKNSVDEHAVELKKRLNDAIDNIKKYVDLAKEDKKTYDRIIGDDAQELKKQLEIGTSTPKNYEINNNSEAYIKDWKKSSDKKIDLGKPATFDKWKTAWAEEAWNSFYKDIEAIKKEALAELGKFAKVELPDVGSGSFQTGFTEADFKAKYATLQTEAKNVVNRAIFERDYADKIKAAMEDIQAINEVVKAGSPFSVQTPSFSRLTDEVTQLDRLLAQPTDAHRSLTKEVLNGPDFKGSYDKCANEIADIKAALVKQAKDALKARIEPTQKSLNETSYKISAKYVNEPNTQKTYELEFAKIQKRLDDLKTKVDAVADFKDIVNTYNTYNGDFDTINKDIDSKWQETLSEQKQEVLRNNHNEAVTLLGNVEEVREAYNTNVLRIKKWVDEPWTDNDTKVKLNANLKELFSVAGGVDKMKEDIVADTLRYTKLINETPDVEFNANDNQYRLLKGKDQVVEFTKNLTKVKEDIMAQIKEAVFTANLRAAKYLNDDPKSNADWYVENAREYRNEYANLWPGTKHEFMSEEAVDLFRKEFRKIAYKDNNQGAGYLDEAKKIIDDGHVTDKAKVDIDKQKLADRVAEVEAIFAKVKPAVDALNEEKDAYKKLYEAIYVQKIDWNVVKAEAATYQNAINDAAKKYNTTGFDVTARLKELNKLFDGKKDVDGCTEDGAYTTLEKGTNPVNAKDAELNASINKKIEEFMAGLDEIRYYPEILKNKAAMTTADADIKAVEAELVNAREAIKAYNETVQAGATQLLNGAESALKTAKAAIEKAYDDRKLADNYTEGQNLKQGLTNASQEIKDALAWAAQAAKDADLDYNGDGKVNVQDLVDADSDFQKTGDGFTFYKFLDAYLEYLSK
ncbi:MAG: hypothetical protein SPF96_09905 [Prevotella sp.]|nr:hypothetical protein [Prevotella sp.]